MEPVVVSLEEMYDGSHESYEAFLATLDESLHPRSPDVLYEKLINLGPTAKSIILDAGCRHAVQACEIHRRIGCRVEGIDFVESNIKEAQENIEKNGLTHAVQVAQGDIHVMPFPDNSFDFIWCRDVLGHMEDLQQAFRSFARVLKPGGRMVLFVVFATNLLSDEEAQHLWTPLATKPENMSRTYFEDAFAAAGFTVEEADEIGSEWREYREESESQMTSKQLLRIARLRRHRERYIAEFGEKDYACELANCHYGVYQMLGKLSPVIYTLLNGEAASHR